MAGKRDRVVDFIKSKGVEVNIGKNKARGNKGFFKAVYNNFRIDIAKGLNDEEVTKVLVHEFAHYIHYCYDKRMICIDFILPNISAELIEELIRLTVNDVDKNSASRLFELKNTLKNEINELLIKIKKLNPDFQLSKPYKFAEKYIKKTNYGHLLKYDKVKIFEGFKYKIYTVEDVDKYELPEEVSLYIKIKSKQRYLKRVTGKINRLNRYYNNVSELFARSVVSYIYNENEFLKLAPKLYKHYNNVINSNSVPLLNELINLFQ